MTNRYNFQRADYPLLQGIRFRRAVLAWGMGLLAWCLLLGSTLLTEEKDNSLHWPRTALIVASLPIAGLGRLALEDSVKAGRVLLDYEDVTDAGRQQLLWQETTDDVQAGAEVEPVEEIDAWAYIGRAAKEWRTHLALLSPTDTGKSSFLYLLLGGCSRAREVCLQVVEGKGAEWAGVPGENVVRINFRPDLRDAHALCYRLHKTLDIIQQRVNQRTWEGPQMAFVLEEYLALSSGLKKRKGAFEPYGRDLELSVEAMAAVARGGGGQLILISQSPNADDLKFSGGVRSNFRVACLGSRLGGFDAIERMIDNYNFVNKRNRDRIEAQYQQAKKQLVSERHPLILTNLLGEWVCFALPYLSEDQINALNIASLPVPDALLVDDGWLPGTDEISSSGNNYAAATMHRPKRNKPNDSLRDDVDFIDLDSMFGGSSSADESDDSQSESDNEKKQNLAEIEGVILDVLTNASEPLKAYEIKRSRQALKRLDKDLFNRILAGMARQGSLQETDEETPRYSLPPV
jgi:hypothetical protein